MKITKFDNGIIQTITSPAAQRISHRYEGNAFFYIFGQTNPQRIKRLQMIGKLMCQQFALIPSIEILKTRPSDTIFKTVEEQTGFGNKFYLYRKSDIDNNIVHPLTDFEFGQYYQQLLK